MVWTISAGKVDFKRKTLKFFRATRENQGRHDVITT